MPCMYKPPPPTHTHIYIYKPCSVARVLHASAKNINQHQSTQTLWADLRLQLFCFWKTPFENIVGKGENAGYLCIIILLSPIFFYYWQLKLDHALTKWGLSPIASKLPQFVEVVNFGTIHWYSHFGM